MGGGELAELGIEVSPDLVGQQLSSGGHGLCRFGVSQRVAAQESGQEMDRLPQLDTDPANLPMRSSSDPVPISGT